MTATVEFWNNTVPYSDAAIPIYVQTSIKLCIRFVLAAKDSSMMIINLYHILCTCLRLNT